MNEKPIILITDPEKQLITKNNIEIEIYNYDNSHLYYNACDLGALKEIANLKLENQQLKIQISAREEEYRKLEQNWNTLFQWLIEQEEKAWDEVSSAFSTVSNKMREMEQGVSDDR